MTAQLAFRKRFQVPMPANSDQHAEVIGDVNTSCLSRRRAPSCSVIESVSAVSASPLRDHANCREHAKEKYADVVVAH